MSISEVGFGADFQVKNGQKPMKPQFKASNDAPKEPEKSNSTKIWAALGALAALGVTGIIIYKNRNTKAVKELETKAEETVRGLSSKGDDAIKPEIKPEIKPLFKNESLPANIRPAHREELNGIAHEYERAAEFAESSVSEAKKLVDEVSAYPQTESISAYYNYDAGKMVVKDANDNIIRRMVQTPDGKGQYLEILDGAGHVVRRIKPGGSNSRFIIDDLRSGRTIESMIDNVGDEFGYKITQGSTRLTFYKQDGTYYLKDDARDLCLESFKDNTLFRIGDKKLLLNQDKNVESFVVARKDSEGKDINTLDMVFDNGALVKYKHGANIEVPEKTAGFMRFVDGEWKNLTFKDGSWSF